MEADFIWHLKKKKPRHFLKREGIASICMYKNGGKMRSNQAITLNIEETNKSRIKAQFNSMLYKRFLHAHSQTHRGTCKCARAHGHTHAVS